MTALDHASSPGPIDPIDPIALAAPLAAAAAAAGTAQPPTGSAPGLDLAGAYAIQREVVDHRIRAGHPLVGYKLGLTSVAKQRQMKVDTPLFGRLTADMRRDVGQPVRCADFAQPRMEPEVAFVIGRDLAGPAVGAAEVLAATATVLPAIDILDSRFAGYSFTLPDVVADNASGGGFVLGGTAVDPQRGTLGGVDPSAGFDLRLVGCVFEVNGRVVATAAGAAVLGHPAAAVAWLVRRLAESGEGLLAGQVVLAGALTEAFAVRPADVVVARIDRLGSLEVGCV